MGRKRIEKTPMALELQRKKWQDTRNAKRRKTYQDNPDYRKDVNIRNRASYSARTGAEGKSIRDKIANVEQFGQVREVLLNEEVVERRCFTIAELAIFWDYHAVTLYKWIGDGRLRSPNVECITTGRGVPEAVYTFFQVEKLTQILADHLDEKAYYNANDEETKEKLAEVLNHHE